MSLAVAPANAWAALHHISRDSAPSLTPLITHPLCWHTTRMPKSP